MTIDLILILITYAIASVVITYNARNRRISITKALLVCLLLTPIVGGIIVFSSPKNIIYHVKQYKCPKCGYSFTERHPKCPFCAKEGETVRLEERIRQMT